MKTYALILTGMALLPQMAGVSAGEDEARTLPRVDAIYNEIMSTLTPEMRGAIDSTIGSGNQGAPIKAGADSSLPAKTVQAKMAADKIRHIDELPDEIRKQVEKTMQEMEARRIERKIEFKEMKRGQ